MRLGCGKVDDLRASYAWIKGAEVRQERDRGGIWDIEAQQYQQPLWQLWGGRARQFPVGVSIGGSTVEDVLARAEKAAGLGYQRFKVKIWPGLRCGAGNGVAQGISRAAAASRCKLGVQPEYVE